MHADVLCLGEEFVVVLWKYSISRIRLVKLVMRIEEDRVRAIHSRYLLLCDRYRSYDCKSTDLLPTRESSIYIYTQITYQGSWSPSMSQASCLMRRLRPAEPVCAVAIVRAGE